MKKLFTENRLFIWLFGFYLIIGFLFLLFIQKGDIVLWTNEWHEPYKDFIFKNLTHLGNGIFFLLVIIILIFFRYYYAIMFMVNFALTGLAVIVLKRLFGLPRPCNFFENKADLYFVEGVKIYANHSFPSGHSAMSFALFCGLSLISKNKKWMFFYFVCALLTGFSRIYLAQHFFIDTYFGAILGVFLTIIIYLLFENYLKSHKPNWQKGLLNII